LKKSEISNLHVICKILHFSKLQKWGCYTPILPKALAHSPNFQKIISKK
jgi:hypothetical protein